MMNRGLKNARRIRNALYRFLPGGPQESEIGTGVLTDGTVTFTRSSTAFEVYSGALTKFNASTPRVTTAGLRIEPAATNKNTLEDVGGANVLNVTTRSLNAVGPDGLSNTAWTITASAGDANHYVGMVWTGSVARHYQSVFLKAGTLSFARVANNQGGLTVDLSNGTVSSQYGTYVSSGAVAYANGWYKVSIVSDVPSTAANAVYIVVGPTATDVAAGNTWTAAGTETLLFYGAMSTVTSYEPTLGYSGASNTVRAADFLTAPTTGWPVTLDISLRYTYAFPTGGVQTLLDNLSVTDGFRFAILATDDLRMVTVSGGVASADTLSSVLTWTPGQTYLLRVRFGSGRHDVWRDGVLVASATGITDPVGQHTALRIGHDSNTVNHANGYFSDLVVHRA